MVELSDEERVALIDLLVGVIEHDLFPLSRRIQLLRSILCEGPADAGVASGGGGRD